MVDKGDDLLLRKPGSRRVLLVEDEPVIQMLGVDYLEELGCNVETAGSASEALRKTKLDDGPFELALVDIGLPDRKGDVLVAELRALYPNLPVVIASGYDDKELRQRLADIADVAFLKKPYSREDLHDVVTGILGL